MAPIIVDKYRIQLWKEKMASSIQKQPSIKDNGKPINLTAMERKYLPTETLIKDIFLMD